MEVRVESFTLAGKVPAVGHEPFGNGLFDPRPVRQRDNRQEAELQGAAVQKKNHPATALQLLGRLDSSYSLDSHTWYAIRGT